MDLCFETQADHADVLKKLTNDLFRWDINQSQ